MLSGATLRACETTGTAVFKIVVSSDSIKNATATSHGRSCLLEADGGGEELLIGFAPKLMVCLIFTRRSICPNTSFCVIGACTSFVGNGGKRKGSSRNSKMECK